MVKLIILMKNRVKLVLMILYNFNVLTIHIQINTYIKKEECIHKKQFNSVFERVIYR